MRTSCLIETRSSSRHWDLHETEALDLLLLLLFSFAGIVVAMFRAGKVPGCCSFLQS